MIQNTATSAGFRWVNLAEKMKGVWLAQGGAVEEDKALLKYFVFEKIIYSKLVSACFADDVKGRLRFSCTSTLNMFHFVISYFSMDIS